MSELKLFQVNYEIPPMRAIWTLLVCCENEERAKEIVEQFRQRSVIRKVIQLQTDREGIIFGR